MDASFANNSHGDLFSRWFARRSRTHFHCVIKVPSTIHASVIVKTVRTVFLARQNHCIIGGRLSSLRAKKWSPRNGVGIFELSLMWGFRICAFWHMYGFFSQNPRFSFFIFDVLTLDFLNGFWLKIIALYTRNKNKRDLIKRMKIKKVMVTFYNHGIKFWHRL